MIIISDLQKKYGTLEVLKNIHLKIEDGEIYGLVGVSGAGKSTLLRCINGLTEYNAGSLKVDGVEVSQLAGRELRKFRSRIGMIFQNFSLLERLNVYENVAFPMRLTKVNEKELDEQVKKMIKLVGLEDKIKSRPRELSGGQKQRVAVARALVMNPKILLCDEATSALDPKNGKAILSLLKDINQQLGITIILVTHQMEAVEQICDRMALVQHGEVVLNGRVEDLFLKNPEPLQELLGSREEVKESGFCFRVIINSDKNYRGFLSDLAVQLGIEFELLSGGVREFKNGKTFLGVIRTESKEKEKILHFFNENDIEFEVLSNEQ